MYKAQLNQIINSLNEALAEAEKFDGGNDSAGRRLRAACQEAKTNLQTLRVEVQTERTNRKANK